MLNSMVGISVVIPLFNGARTIGQQLDALAAQTAHDFEVIVADNGSTDNSIEVLETHPLRTKLVDASYRRGQGHARNVGAAVATGDKLLFTDQDDVVGTSWVQALADALDTHPLVGGALDEYTLNRHIARWRPVFNRVLDGAPLPFAVGCNIGIRRSVLEALGGWPEIPGEDVALSWTALAAGHELGYAPEAVVAYRWRDGLVSHARQMHFYGRATVELHERFAGQVGAVQYRSPLLTAKVLVRNLAWLTSHETRGLWLGTLGEQSGIWRARVVRRLHRGPCSVAGGRRSPSGPG